MIAATAAQMKAIDLMTIEEYHIPGIILMENAALKVTEVLQASFSEGPVTLVCGVGNNGGDGLAVARQLYMAGRKVSVLLVGNLNKHTADTKVMYRAILGLEIPVFHLTGDEELNVLDQLSIECTVVDGLFGIGCTRNLEGFYKEAVYWMNKCRNRVSIDMASGIHCDTGKRLNASVRADKTVTFTLPKVGHFMADGRFSCGELIIAPIGVPEKVLSRFDFNYELIDQDILQYLPKRMVTGHKLTFGRILIIAGSDSMSGAAVMATKAAYRSGAGLVEVLTHEKVMGSIQLTVPEAIVHTFSGIEGQTVEAMIGRSIKDYNAILIGPGLSQSPFAQRLLEEVLCLGGCPLVIDADGLNLLPKCLEQLDAYAHPIILTPHIGEMSRLTGHDGEVILDRPFDYGHAYAQAHGVILVLKSARTIIADSEGNYCINILGNQGMATAGSGDVLAGITVSLLGQSIPAFKAAALGVGLHSYAGDLAAEKKGRTGLMATDIIDGLSLILR